MENKICIYLLGMLVAFPMTMNGAAEQPIPEMQPSEDKVTLISSDKLSCWESKEVASLSMVVKNRLEEFPKTKMIDFPKVNGKSLANLLPLMEYAYTVQREPLRAQIEKIGEQITAALKGADLQAWKNLVHIIDYLNIEILKRPLADSLIKYIYAREDGNREKIEKFISDWDVPAEYKELLAKYWYLNHGKDRNYIKPIVKVIKFVQKGEERAKEEKKIAVDYGFSIQELAAYNKLPAIVTNYGISSISLDNARINDLTGLTSIPGILTLQQLNLSYNKLNKFPDNIFKDLHQLTVLNLDMNELAILPDDLFIGPDQLGTLNLSYNKLTKLPANILKPLKNLHQLNLFHNELKMLPEDIFKGLNNLNEIGLSYNRLETLPEKILEGHKLYSLYLGNNLFTPEIKRSLKARFAGIVTNLHLEND